MEGRICQSCGMPMMAAEHFGINRDKSLNPDYCCFCFQDGAFTDHFTFSEFVEDQVTSFGNHQTASGPAPSKNELILKGMVSLQDLKRWRSHQTTHQEYYKSVNRAVDFIHEHLAGQINLSDLARIVHLSEFHFHRIFKAVMNESPGDYIQRLRLEKAAFRLQTTKVSVSEIAEETGYQSVHALSKAFKKRFDRSPAAFRRVPSELTVVAEPPAVKQLSPEIRKLNDTEVVYTRVMDPYRQSNAFTLAWQKLISHMKVTGIPDKQYEYMSFSRDVSTITRPDRCRVYVCITNVPGLKASGKFGVLEIKGGLFAVFTHKGSYEELEDVYCSIYRNWIPNSNYELRDIGFFEKYLNSPEIVSKDELLTEIWIPVNPTGHHQN
jgi:AraC family transcriptional regulator